MKLWNLVLTASVLAVPAIVAASPAKRDRPKASAITEIALARTESGPEMGGHGWPQDKIVLRPQAETAFSPPDEFPRLAQWLLKSGFFFRKEGYLAPQNAGDVGYLVITVVRGGKRKKVYSYNGIRDAELWQTEMVIRGVAAARQLEAARSAWVKKHTEAEMEGVGE